MNNTNNIRNDGWFNFEIFSSFDDRIKDAVKNSRDNQDEKGIELLRNIKEDIEVTFASLLSFVGREVDIGLMKPDVEILGAIIRNQARIDAAIKSYSDVTPEIKVPAGNNYTY